MHWDPGVSLLSKYQGGQINFPNCTYPPVSYQTLVTLFFSVPSSRSSLSLSWQTLSSKIYVGFFSIPPSSKSLTLCNSSFPPIAWLCWPDPASLLLSLPNHRHVKSTVLPLALGVLWGHMGVRSRRGDWLWELWGSLSRRLVSQHGLDSFAKLNITELPNYIMTLIVSFFLSSFFFKITYLLNLSKALWGLWLIIQFMPLTSLPHLVPWRGR